MTGDPKRTLLYCFSGTGNSLHAAGLLAGRIPGAEIRPVTRRMPAETVGGHDVRLGFVFPSYFGRLPRLVQAFVEGLDVAPDTYCFAVVTMGGVGAGSIAVLADLLRQKGRRLFYGAAVRMAGNYIMRYDPDPLGKTRKNAMIDQRILAVAEDIRRGAASGTRRFKFAAGTLYKNIPQLDAAFFTTGRCDACGICGKLCPADNIEIRDGGPVWLHRCEHCTACINWCPRRAIEYGSKTAGRKRYHHPDVRLADMLGHIKQGGVPPYAKSDL